MKLQSIQNAAARLISRTRKFDDHITPVVHNLHWLPIQRRIDFKVATLVYKCLHGCAPPYLAQDFVFQYRQCQTGAICVQPTPALCLFPGQRRRHTAHGRSPLQDPLHGTVFLQISDCLTLTRTSVENSKLISLICDCCHLLRFSGASCVN